MPRHKHTKGSKRKSGGRPVWSGTLSFSLVSLPVQLYPANREKRVTMHMVAPDGTRLQQRYVSESGKPLGDDDIVRGYEIRKGKFIVLDDDELQRLAPERTRDLGVQAFVKVDDIDPMYFERAYYLVPAGGSTQAYRLLARVMEDTGRAGIATFVMRAKEHLAAIVSENGILRLETLRFADELRSPKDVGLPKPKKPRPATVKSMERQISRHTRKTFDRKQLEDKSALKLEHLADAKRRKHEDVVKVPASQREQEEPDVIDLMAQLRRSMKNAKRA